MLIVFALVPNVPLAGAALLFTGVSNAAFSVMQATLIYLAAPAEMRSRMYGVLSVCIGAGPIGFLYLGVLADAIGAPWATAITGTLGLVALAATRRWWRISARPDPPCHEEAGWARTGCWSGGAEENRTGQEMLRVLIAKPRKQHRPGRRNFGIRPQAGVGREFATAAIPHDLNANNSHLQCERLSIACS